MRVQQNSRSGATSALVAAPDGRPSAIDRPSQVRAADITYLPVGRAFLYLVAVMDWAIRAVLSWRLSNAMDVSVCVAALEDVLAQFGKLESFNAGQVSQSASNRPRFRAFSVRLESGRIPKQLSMRESNGIDSPWGDQCRSRFAGLA